MQGFLANLLSSLIIILPLLPLRHKREAAQTLSIMLRCPANLQRYSMLGEEEGMYQVGESQLLILAKGQNVRKNEKMHVHLFIRLILSSIAT